MPHGMIHRLRLRAQEISESSFVVMKEALVMFLFFRFHNSVDPGCQIPDAGKNPSGRALMLLVSGILYLASVFYLSQLNAPTRHA